MLLKKYAGMYKFGHINRALLMKAEFMKGD